MRRLNLALAALLVLGAVAPAATAQSDDGVLENLVEDDSEDRDWSAIVGAALERASWSVSQISFDGPADQEIAEEDRGDLQETFNANNATIETYVNDRFSGNHSAWDVIAITHVRGDGEATQYLVADVNNSTFVNARMVNSTDRTVDKKVTLEKMASDRAHEELETFVEEYAEPNQTVDGSYVDQLAAKYGGNVDPPEGVL